MAARTAKKPSKVNPKKQSSAASRARTSPPQLKRINAALKTIVVAAEPPLDPNPADLAPSFREKLAAALTELSAQGSPFRLVEGFRTLDRQQWLFGSGRPSAVPYGRPGPILTNADGVRALSKHQGNGTPGSGLAADCYPLQDGKVYIPGNDDPIWDHYAAAVVAQGLVAGRNFPTLRDSPHCELP